MFLTFMTIASTFIVTGCSHPEEQHIKMEQSLPMTETVAEAPLWLEEVEGKQALDKVKTKIRFEACYEEPL